MCSFCLPVLFHDTGKQKDHIYHVRLISQFKQNNRVFLILVLNLARLDELK